MESTSETNKSTANRHHHHHHHHSRRRRRLRTMIKKSLLIGFSAMAFLFILLFLYAALRDAEIEPLIFKALLPFAAVGFVVGGIYFYVQKRQQEKERQ